MGKSSSKETNEDDFFIARHPVDYPNNANEFTSLINGYLQRITDSQNMLVPTDIINIILTYYPFLFILEQKAIFQYQMITEQKVSNFSLSSSYAWSADTGPRKVDNCMDYLTEQINIHSPNTQPSKVLTYLASFLYYRHRALDRSAIGFYLAKQQSVFEAYKKLLKFKGQSIDNALRNYLTGFALSGDEQEIHSFMKQFSDAYCSHNEQEFEDLTIDDVYLLSYAVILLNTTMQTHKKSNRLTKAEWISTNDFENTLQSVAAKSMVNELYDNTLLNRIE